MAAKKATKKAAKKDAAESTGKRGRTSAYAGKKITKLVTVKGNQVTNAKDERVASLRETGFVRECWDAISNGILFETFRNKTSHPGMARKVLADFILKDFVELS